MALLIPNGTLGVRDIGIQYNLKALKNNLQFNLGFFNGYGIKEYRFNNTGLMVTQNLSYHFQLINNMSLKLGYSIMFRKAENLYLPGIVPDTVYYTGNEFGLNIHALFNSKFVDAQAEYLQANLDSASANGYYALVTVKFNSKNQVYLMYDHYLYGYETPGNNPWYVIGLNHFFKSFKTMITLETGFREVSGKLNNRTTLQFQLFFN